MWALLQRELRTLARRPGAHWLRVLAAAALIVPLLVVSAMDGFTGADNEAGAALFRAMHLTTLAFLGLLTPLMTADCLSRERREDTLGLLFMTPLRPSAVVMAKALVHGLRALLLMLGAFPVMTIPLILGGVSAADTGRALLSQLTVIALGLAAGVLGSCRTRSVVASTVGSVVVAGFLYLVGLMLLGFITGMMPSFTLTPGSYQSVAEVALEAGAELASGEFSVQQTRWNIRGPTSSISIETLIACAATTIAGLAILRIALWIAGRLLQQSWQTKPRTPEQLRREENFTKPLPLWDRAYRRWLRLHLNRNPVGWLARRSIAGRLLLTTWMTVLVWIGVRAALAGRESIRAWSETAELLVPIGWLIAIHAGLVAAGSFRVERENGALELLLVTPLGERPIITGRLLGLWSQLLPLASLLLVLWIASISGDSRGAYRADFWTPEMVWRWLLPLIAMFNATTIGLYCSMRCRHHAVALIATFGLGLFLPMLAKQMMDGGILRQIGRANSYPEFLEWLPLLAWVFTQVMVALICANELHQHLQQRKFARTG